MCISRCAPPPWKDRRIPFTGSHPAAVVPFLLSRRARRWLAPSALVIGTMVPDLPYYLPPPANDVPVGWTHTTQGVIGFDLAAGVLCVLLWHGLLGPAAVSVLPSAVRRRTGVPKGVPDLPSLPVVCGLLVGATTHVVWDEFTHPDRFGTRHLAWLAQRHGALEGYRWAQYASGVIGGIVVLAAVLTCWRHAEPRPDPGGAGRRPSALVWTAVSAATVVGAVAGALHGVDDGLRRVLFGIATWGGGAGAATALVCAVVLAVTARPDEDAYSYL